MVDYLDPYDSEYAVEGGPSSDYTDGPSNVAPVDEGFDEDLEPQALERIADVGKHF